MTAITREYFDLSGGINTYVNPLTKDGLLIHAVNVKSSPYGAMSKRTGYSTFLGTADGAQVNSLFSFPNIGNYGTTVNLFRASGSALYHSVQGTGAWTLSGNGTITNGAHVGNAILDNVLVVGESAGATRHSTNGTSFTDTTFAPVGEFLEQFQNRIYIAGTSSTLFYSTTNDATNWNTSGTSDSSSFEVPGAGKLGRVFKTGDKLITSKNTGLMHKWDGYSLIDMATSYGPSSPYSVANTEDYRFFINQYGHYGFGGAKPQLLSNSIQRQFYNDADSGIEGSALATIPGECHRYDYLVSVGTIIDDFTSRTISDAIIKYDYQKNEYLNWSFANKPTAFHSYKDTSGSQQLIFGDSGGQCYKLDNTTSDNGNAISCELVYVYTFGSPEFDKSWHFWRGFFNPGCEAKVQIATTNTYDYSTLRWAELGDCGSGIVEYRFPNSYNSSKLLFVRIYESSKNSRMSYYGAAISADVHKIE
jgi:hypothetical protein